MLLFYPNARKDRTYRIPDSITAIGSFAFCDCGLLESIFIPDSIVSIGKYAFSWCTSLTLTLSRNSYAAEYAQINDIFCTCVD